MSNERITENIVRDKLRALGYYDDPDIFVEEQSSVIDVVRRLLRFAGKAGRAELGGKGAPEFIISTKKTNDFLIVVECKANVRDHESPNHNQPIKYAVDGVLHYARILSKEFNVIAIAVSGSTLSELKVSSFIWPKQQAYKPLTNQSGNQIHTLLSVDDYITYGTYDPQVQSKRLDDLMGFSRELHDFMRDHAKLTESEKPLLVSGTLIAFRNAAFRSSYDKYDAKELQDAWFNAINQEIQKADIPNSKRENMAQPYSTIRVHPELGKATSKFPRGTLYELIKRLDEHVWPYVSVYHDYDVVGRFYGEFLKYTGGDKKALGIVLTPRHITELFAHLANLQKNSKVLDTCCGTGGFLISAMNYMMTKTTTTSEQERIRKEGLFGVEQQPNMYALAASNMLLRGDGKANLYQGSCFDEGIFTSIKNHKCDAGFINPPYSQADEESKELVFVKTMLDALSPGGTGVVIVPMRCAISPSPLKDELLAYHTLEAVMSMPDELFYPVGTVTCIMVFRAHTPHQQSDRKTWFGYWKNDGFSKTKHLGRVDLNNTWPQIRDRWVRAYRNQEDIPGESVKHYVGPQDEWCAEAYMDADYSTLGSVDYSAAVKSFNTYKYQNRDIKVPDKHIDGSTHKTTVGEIFEVKYGVNLELNALTLDPDGVNFVSRTARNNGVSARVKPLEGVQPIEGGVLSVAGGGSVMETFLQEEPFYSGRDLYYLKPKLPLTKAQMLFYCMCLRANKFRFNYGRQANRTLAQIEIPTPEAIPAWVDDIYEAVDLA
jgi:type I restriction enzyme M protein